MKLFDEEGNEVEAFDQKEVDAKIKEAGTESAAKVKTAEDALAEKTKEYDGLSKKYDDKKESYSELQKKSKEDGKKYEDRAKEDKDAYNKTVDDKIAEIAGDDKEYAAELKNQMEMEGGVGSETTDAEAIGKQIEKATALTKIELEREVKSPVDGGGAAPDSPDGSDVNFTETEEGKNTFDVMSNMMGLPAEEEAK